MARLEIGSAVDPADAPWPDRENLHPSAHPAAASTGTGSAPDLASPPAASRPAADQAGQAADQAGQAGHRPPTAAPEDDGRPGESEPGAGSPGARGPADRSRVIRPAGSTWVFRPACEPAGDAATGPLGQPGPDELADIFGPAGPRDYELDEPSDDDLDDDDRYIPPPLPPQPKLDPVAKGAWIALFGGPGYLLLGTLLSWQIAGWAALTAVIAFVTGFIVLVIRLGDGPSKRDGPDQGAVV